MAATRFATAAIVVIALGVAGLTTGGPAQERPAANPVPSEPAGEASGAFVMHETPQPVPELSFVSGEGEKLSLADFRGRTILLSIWATWCLPCRREMPALDRLQAELGGRGFEVVPLSIDRDGVPKVRAFYQEIGLKSLGIYIDASGKAPYRVGALGIPTTLLIDPEGREAGRLAGEADWDGPEFVTIIQQRLNKAAGTAD
ncbi:TlpA family protein disulfide reductase [Sinorhizobium meliloti]|uniref:TlpA family protein disulfide reductase n=1 Tax=Rhizobium meliloti TaxID=382 RepID=UPI0012FE6AD9|nr:TlpA disulfide reductase family protein [Sinorhizobium meliloti]